VNTPLAPAVKLTRLAEMDIQDTMEWYSARSLAVGEAFVGAVYSSFAQIAEHPEGAPLVYKKARRLVMHGFPYGIFYVYERKRVHVVAVMHWRRDPHDWQVRVR
jgi:plasmid stabilization system protein ParE